MLQPLALALSLAAPQCPDLVVPSGQVRVYDTDLLGPLCVEDLIVEAGATLRVVGSEPFVVTASGSVVIEGTLDLSGRDSPGVVTLNTTNIPEPGALAGPAGGLGGIGSALTNRSTPAGRQGLGAAGGQGGETSFSALGKGARRGAGGGGGVLAPDQPVAAHPLDPANLGLVALRGWPGGPAGSGALSGASPARGGLTGGGPFVDGDPTNDFWGVSALGVVGELARPLAGSGGGAGGDAVDSASFPLVPFTPSGDEKGAGGGGGGGLGLVLARELRLGPAGRIRADGGAGGGGENTLFFDRVGGGSGGGSGGMLVLEAQLFDLSLADDRALTALGGAGGPGEGDTPYVTGAGGNGGPGLLQLHTPDGTEAAILLPPGKTLTDVSAPTAHVLLPALGG